MQHPPKSYKKMWTWLNDTLMKFEKCFSRKAAFHWFVIVVIGLMLRNDYLGVTSIIRTLDLSPKTYELLLHFFRAASWKLYDIRLTWIHIVKKSGYLFCEGQQPILIGDGVKTSKEARKMPCVKRLHQESENSSKANFIFGHMFGALGILIGTNKKMFCLPLSMTIQNGNQIISQWINDALADDSHVVRLIREACVIASHLRPCILLLDRYFLTVPALQAKLEAEKYFGDTLLTIVTKAKSNAVAYEKPVRKFAKGRPPIKGDTVKLKELFVNQTEAFVSTNIEIYGQLEPIQFLCKDLLWGKGLYQTLRFVLVKHGISDTILVCSDISLTPEQIIRLYSYRFKIEVCFRAFKQLIAGFAYHFWTKYMPKLNHFAPTHQMDEILASIDTQHVKEKISAAFGAIQGFVMFGCIAMGLLQICALRFNNVMNRVPMRWLRTPSDKIASEATTADFLRKSFFRVFALRPNLPLMHFIQCRQNGVPQVYDLEML
jgi:hypothetical protein